jgi:hypothetical protein
MFDTVRHAVDLRLLWALQEPGYNGASLII